MSVSYINAIGTAVPAHDVHRAFIGWAERRIEGVRERALFRRMAERSGIGHRWSVLPEGEGGGSPVDAGGFYADAAPPTSRRMEVYAAEAPRLALEAIARLGEQVSLDGVTHLVVASCTGFTAPGIDQIIAEALGLHEVERTLVGFMGCYAAVSALRVANHIVRAEPAARVLAVTVELSSLHLQETSEVEPLLAMLQFSDGAAAALLSRAPQGFAIEGSFALSLEKSAELITWTIGDTGFAMHLSGAVPGRIGAALQDDAVRARMLGPWTSGEIDGWAVHAGGRSIVDAVEKGMSLAPEALAEARDVLARYGNMSSSTLMFVLADLLERGDVEKGLALAFGPGLAAEGFRFSRAAG
ncbi:MAG TPA: type III polyketide synthase [Allosphingosinicella sp.]